MNPEQATAADLDEIPCEACACTGELGSGPAEPQALGERLVWLCEAHRAKARGADSAEALRAIFREPGGQRGLVPRRAEDRRVFPPRPEGRRKGTGRRRADPEV
jgi:hypothetical protein